MKKKRVLIVDDQPKTGMEMLVKLLTPAQKTFHNVTIINERPEGMSFEDYKKFRKGQTKGLKHIRR